MNTAAKELALALGMLALTTSCTAASNTSTQTQQSQKVTEVRDSGKAATAREHPKCVKTYFVIASVMK
ncbi:hypothetical protein [Nostoc mirabile]|uniref:hypothetical protein n=1 Tax=Nostoc mirabile TaxID=2907820 RepID=UPI0022782555|nr:hypothetical protein [Nostoc mirabile]